MPRALPREMTWYSAPGYSIRSGRAMPGNVPRPSPEGKIANDQVRSEPSAAHFRQSPRVFGKAMFRGERKPWRTTALQMPRGYASTREPAFLTNPSTWLVFVLAFLAGIVYNSSVFRGPRFAG